MSEFHNKGDLSKAYANAQMNNNPQYQLRTDADTVAKGDDNPKADITIPEYENKGYNDSSVNSALEQMSTPQSDEDYLNSYKAYNKEPLKYDKQKSSNSRNIASIANSILMLGDITGASLGGIVNRRQTNPEDITNNFLLRERARIAKEQAEYDKGLREALLAKHKIDSTKMQSALSNRIKIGLANSAGDNDANKFNAGTRVKYALKGDEQKFKQKINDTNNAIKNYQFNRKLDFTAKENQANRRNATNNARIRANNSNNKEDKKAISFTYGGRTYTIPSKYQDGVIADFKSIAQNLQLPTKDSRGRESTESLLERMGKSDSYKSWNEQDVQFFINAMNSLKGENSYPETKKNMKNIVNGYNTDNNANDKLDTGVFK